MLGPLMGSLMKGVAQNPSSAPASPDAARRQMMEVVFGRLAPQAEAFIESPHSGRAAGAATIVLGALLLPRLIGSSK